MNYEFECDRLDRRRRAIVDAARALFIEQGYERTTLGQIVDRAGGSLATVYKLFGNKEGLLDAVVFEKAASGECVIREVAARHRSPPAMLRELAGALYERFLEPDDVALVRMVIARSIDDVDFARRFFETTAMHTRKALEDVFVEWADAGVAMSGPPEVLSEIFLGLIISDLQNDAISHGVMARPGAERIAERTEFFLRGAGLDDARENPGRAETPA
ncbi:TetR/AcrR family transcriptional regulator [Pelagerythrobacter marinus]|uniref:TetR/AcrR family transcriptional regulator n=1 Tax=Pelagerythrobacter marinus TaxID=538382 RepID=UPI0020368724|nr:TetR/AcrR family transcriptional regulator [Pelagerythrobacter marinus]MEC9067164.1 TetR/AcrR family transcriptional regulator [Pseudomonadota bacterium]USA38461.1 TetR/AcrR family transcriptional regulator [Pelagerythrobacter marinus]WPZ07515.1 TetR/AcrR family transcriptional regulator [Pelagerythrobacter marinus]